MKKHFDLVRKKPDEEMAEVARQLGVELIHRHPRIGVAEGLSSARKLLGRVKAIFTPEVDEPFLSLARQRGVFVGFFTSDVNHRNLGRFMRWVRLAEANRVPILLSTGAREVLELRSPRDVARIGILLGMRRENAFAAVGYRWREVLEG